MRVISCTSIETKAWVSNYIQIQVWDVIAHTRPEFNDGLVKPPLKLGYR